MLAAYHRLRKRVQGLPDPPNLGVREAFLAWLDPDLREQIAAIYTTYFPLEQESRHWDVFERSRVLTKRATSALENAGGAVKAESDRLNALRQRGMQ